MSAVIPVLLYHCVSHRPPGWIAPFTVTPDAFEHQLDVVMRSGRPTCTVAELLRWMDRPTAPPPVAITFDDGFADTVDTAMPQLTARAFTATAYIATGPLTRAHRDAASEMISEDGVRALDAAGWEVGAHGHTHVPLDAVPPHQITAEVRTCTAILEEILGHNIGTFAYPYGHSSPDARRIVERAGFGGACGVRNAFTGPSDDRFRLARLMVTADTDADQVARWLAGVGAPVAPPERLRTRAARSARRARWSVPPRPRPPAWAWPAPSEDLR